MARTNQKTTSSKKASPLKPKKAASPRAKKVVAEIVDDSHEIQEQPTPIEPDD